MRCELPTYLSSPEAYLGETVDTAEEAIAARRIDAQIASKYGYEQLTVSDFAPVQMAAMAADRTLLAAELPARELGLVLHAWTHFQGHEFWSPAHYVASSVGAVAAVPIGIQQMCNGGMAAIDLAAKQLIADPDVASVLVTTADRFAAPGFDRWGGDLGVCYGDGATAVLVTRAPRGPSVRLHAVATVAAPELEEMHRGDEPFSAAPKSGTEALQPRATKKQFHDRNPAKDLSQIAHAAMRTLIGKTLEESGLSPADPRIRAIVLPRLSKNGLDDVYRGAIAKACAGPIWDLGGRTGHLGAGDSVANLAEVLASGEVASGEFCLLIGAGAGFTWSAAIVEVV